MTMLSREMSETSVTFSLAELAKIEEERLREEETRRAQTREQKAREQHEAAARRRAEEEARIAAQEETRARAARDEAEAKARAQAREQAALTVARIEAEGKARLEADNAQRAHELALMRVRNESGTRKLKLVLAAVLGVAVVGGSIAGFAAHRQVASLEQDVERLREDQSAAAKERDQAKTSELTSLDRRLEGLLRRPLARDAKDAIVTAEEARKAIDVKALEHGRLHAFAEAVDALEMKLDTLERLQALDGRLKDLDTWAAQRKKGDLVASARSAAASARATGDSSSVKAYEVALDQLRDALGARAGGGGAVTGDPDGKGPQCKDPNDPLCGLNGRAL